MGKIIIKGISGDTNCPKNKLEELDGIDDQQNFANYSDFESKLHSGYMSFEVIEGILYTITEYETKEVFSEEELQKLAKETQGQWSDGIGEGFEQGACTIIDGEEIYISPWNKDQKLIIIQE